MKDIKVAIITGASRGIGLATAELLAKNDFQVVGTYLNNKELAEDLAKMYSNIFVVKTDASKETDVKTLIDKTIERYGQLDVVVNNAGMFNWGKSEDVSLSNWNEAINVNLTSKFLVSKYAIPYLRNSENAVIINLSSRVGLPENAGSQILAYSVTSAGIIQLSQCLSKEYETDNIRVNTIIPTVTDTDRFRDTFTKEEQDEIIKAGKLGTPKEAAELILKAIIDKSLNAEVIKDPRISK